MSEYANVKRRRIYQLLKWLGNKKDVYFYKGGNHNYIIDYPFWKSPFPVLFRHNEVNKHIVKALMNKLVKSEICSKEEFDKKIK